MVAPRRRATRPVVERRGRGRTADTIRDMMRFVDHSSHWKQARRLSGRPKMAHRLAAGDHRQVGSLRPSKGRTDPLVTMACH
ncbi:hypothetical protein roselon_00320 [Roseibacterium elongatum DSM 19469]|uniref:Uncharacterized protein n=1 Tax=Roseicyclus elongatus DSM 19469 TaxID=1294273 RepID=W8RP30_9RHOB|nr:hypothetical protein roselon_00320 [Roseibacterium elongatum DSM 19469]